MLVVVRRDGLSIEEPDRTDRLQIDVAENVDAAAALARLATIGLVDGEHGWLDTTQLAARSGRADDVAWQERFDAMLAYARSHGWVREVTLVRAHIAREPQPSDAQS